MVMDKEYYIEYRRVNKEALNEKQKQRRLENPEKYKEYNKKYYMKNRKKLIDHQLERVECKYCNHKYKRGNLSAHKRTDKHIRNKNNYVEPINGPQTISNEIQSIV